MAADSSPIRLFSTDLDGTLIGNPESTQRFKQTWERLAPEQRPLLVYNSGRTVKDTQSLVASRKLPKADLIIGGVGTELFDPKNRPELADFGAQFGEGWDLAEVEKIVGSMPGIERQPPEFLHPYKSSWYWNRVDRSKIAELQRRLEEAGLRVNVVYSSLRDLDVLPL